MMIKLPIVLKGMKRSFYKCLDCGQYQSHDYIPYSISPNSMKFNPCLCQLTSHRTHRLKTVTEKEFYKGLKDKK